MPVCEIGELHILLHPVPDEAVDVWRTKAVKCLREFGFAVCPPEHDMPEDGVLLRHASGDLQHQIPSFFLRHHHIDVVCILLDDWDSSVWQSYLELLAETCFGMQDVQRVADRMEIVRVSSLDQMDFSALGFKVPRPGGEDAPTSLSLVYGQDLMVELKEGRVMVVQNGQEISWDTNLMMLRTQVQGDFFGARVSKSLVQMASRLDRVRHQLLACHCDG